MHFLNTDRDWDRIGKLDPYWGVLSDDMFRKDNLTDDAVKAFFDSGEDHITSLFETIRTRLDHRFAPRSALDFGCGVGRLLVPLAKRCRSVVGVDVSDGMLAEARSRCGGLGLSNVRLVKSDDRLSRVHGTFDLVHSVIVLQHIPCRRGERLFRRLVQLINDGGVGVLHVTYGESLASRRLRFRALLKRLGVYYPFRWARRLGRKLLGKPANEPGEVQMNLYSLNRIFGTLQSLGVRQVHLEFTDHQDNYGVILFFRKPASRRHLSHG